MSVTTNQPRRMNLPRPKPRIVPVTHDNVRDWWALLVNRKAYTRQSANPHPETRAIYKGLSQQSPAHESMLAPSASIPSTITMWLSMARCRNSLNSWNTGSFM